MHRISFGTQLAWMIAAQEAVTLEYESIYIEHMMIALLKICDIDEKEIKSLVSIDGDQWLRFLRERDQLKQIFDSSNLAISKARKELRSFIGGGGQPYSGGTVHRDKSVKKMFDQAEEIRKDSAESEIILPLLLAAVLKSAELSDRLQQYFSEADIDKDALLTACSSVMEGAKQQQAEIESRETAMPAKAPVGPVKEDHDTPFLNKYGRDLTRLAREGKLGPVIGRSAEIKKIIQVLSKQKKNNAILVGEAGTGKTCVVEGLAQKLVSGTLRPELAKLRIVELKVSSLLAGTKYRGDFEERMESILREAKEDVNIILFIDEVHTIVGAGDGGGGGLDAANIIKPELARSEMRCIGATTIDEYRKLISQDKALERRFEMVWIDEPTRDETVEILKGLRPTYEEHHGVKISDEAVEAAVDLSIRYLLDLRLPDKALDLLDQACAQLSLGSLSLTPEDFKRLSEAKGDAKLVGFREIAKAVAERAHIPLDSLTLDEKDRLQQLDTLLKRHVIGQDEAVKEVGDAVRRARAGLKKKAHLPDAVMLFLGATGIGKTELAKALAREVYGGEERGLISIDMSEYQQEQSVTRLVGADPGYVGYGEEGLLIKSVRTHPYSVVLLDEIEKAHPNVWITFMQVFDEGRLTDSTGRRADFSNTFIIMTSNLGAGVRIKKKKGRMGISVSEETVEEPAEEFDREDYRQTILQAVEDSFKPELRMRIQKHVVFYPLDREAVRQIAEKEVSQLVNRLAAKGITLTVDDSAYEIILAKGYSIAYGVRHLQRTIERMIQEQIAAEIISGAISGGSIINIKAADDGESLLFEK
ncbi:MAG TPA: ATP-dependent Clp protease ATP-binding subunit [Acidobacteriota bacterium]|nr:ATP-dependent Clp protease ATP-binding subunit [Acidobacteriota bacterium]